MFAGSALYSLIKSSWSCGRGLCRGDHPERAQDRDLVRGLALDAEGLGRRAVSLWSSRSCIAAVTFEDCADRRGILIRFHGDQDPTLADRFVIPPRCSFGDVDAHESPD